MFNDTPPNSYYSQCEFHQKAPDNTGLDHLYCTAWPCSHAIDTMRTELPKGLTLAKVPFWVDTGVSCLQECCLRALCHGGAALELQSIVFGLNLILVVAPR